MPSGEVHFAYWKKGLKVAVLVAAAIFVAGLLYSSYLSEFALWFLFWYWCGRWCDPDLDLIGISAAEGRLLRELDLLGVFILPLTTFYAAGIGYVIRKFRIPGAIGGSHRTWLTHSLIPGTLLRCVFICICLGSVINWADFIFGYLRNGALHFHPYDLAAFGLAQFMGLGIADAIHIWLDSHYQGGE